LVKTYAVFAVTQQAAVVRLQEEEQIPKYGVDSPLWQHAIGLSLFLSYNREQRRKRFLYERLHKIENESLKEEVSVFFRKKELWITEVTGYCLGI